MLSMGIAADRRRTFHFTSTDFDFDSFDNMTKLTEWIILAGLAFSLWITLLADILPFKVSYKAKEVIWPVRSGELYQENVRP